MKNAMVTVIIPALNEAETIGTVIGLVKRSPMVSEIIVIDDKSHDNTVHNARESGATVYTRGCLKAKRGSLSFLILILNSKVAI